mgnify:CR=1 FL=1|uniref:Uncharacterized protein n=1 Tax=viral metagenome TaxID=1070528 RepID=A0A6C0LZF7_9ZZZZ
MPDSNYDDMPALQCGSCSNISSKGGYKWEEENPSVIMCCCPDFHVKRQIFEPSFEELSELIGGYFQIIQVDIGLLYIDENTVLTNRPKNIQASDLAHFEIMGNTVLWINE